jgi:shikimate 5-dehydrogenase
MRSDRQWEQSLKNAAPADWQSRATVTVPEYAAIMRVARQTAYAAVQAGEVPTIKLRGRILVCVPALLRQLGA